jgi:hypothetical protein
VDRFGDQHYPISQGPGRAVGEQSVSAKGVARPKATGALSSCGRLCAGDAPPERLQQKAGTRTSFRHGWLQDGSALDCLVCRRLTIVGFVRTMPLRTPPPCERIWVLRDPPGKRTAERVSMLRVIVRSIQLQFLLLCLWLVCYSVAGTEKAPFWFALVSVTLFFLTVAGMIAQRRR